MKKSLQAYVLSKAKALQKSIEGTAAASIDQGFASLETDTPAGIEAFGEESFSSRAFAEGESIAVWTGGVEGLESSRVLFRKKV